VLRLAESQPQDSYALGTGGWQYGASPIASLVRRSTTLISSDAQTLGIQKKGASSPTPGSVVRLVTEDNFVYPFTVSSVRDQGDAWHVQVVEPLLLKYQSNPSKLMLLSYPQREHTGPIQCQWESL